MFTYFVYLIFAIFYSLSSVGNVFNPDGENQFNQGNAVQEEIVEFEGYDFYLSYPEDFEGKGLDLIVYNPGSTSTIPSFLDQDIPYDILWFAPEISKQDYIFVSGNFPGHSFSSFSATDFSLLNRFLEDLSSSFNFDPNKINFVSYSAGAYFSMYYTNAYPEKVKKLALIAPGYNDEYWSDGNLTEKFSDKKIKIWHGENDNNISHQNSVTLRDRFERLGLNIELVSKQNLTHFDKLLTYKDLYLFLTN